METEFLIATLTKHWNSLILKITTSRLLVSHVLQRTERNCLHQDALYLKKHNKRKNQAELVNCFAKLRLPLSTFWLHIRLVWSCHEHIDPITSCQDANHNLTMFACDKVCCERNLCISLTCVGGAVASWLVRSSPDRAVRVRALAGDIVLCSWARHLTLTVPLSTQVYKWVPANLMLGGNPAMD